MTPRGPVVFLDGAFVSAAKARVSPDDRGFLFGDGVYEGIAAYRGRLFRWDDHAARLARSLAAVRIEPPASDLRAIAEELLARNDLTDRDATVYLQVTRGAAPRTHAFPRPAVPPTVYAVARPLERPSRERIEGGVAAITVPDERWGRCDVKAIALLPNVLAKEAAVEAGAAEALFVRDGAVLEGSHTNVFAVVRGGLVTHPAGPRILDGVTRRIVLGLARGLGIPAREAAIGLAGLAGADEVFLTGTSTEIQPVIAVDGRPVGEGRPGPVALRLAADFRELTLRETAE